MNMGKVLRVEAVALESSLSRVLRLAQRTLWNFLVVLSFLVLSIFPIDLFAAPASDSEALKNLAERVRSFTLDNGVRVLFYPRGEAPVFAGVVMVRVGGIDEKVGQTGISHMLEHMAFKGTKHLGTKDYQKEKKLLGQLESLARESHGGTDLSPKQAEEWQKIRTQLEELWETKKFDQEFKKRGAVGLNATTSKELTTYFVNFPKSAFEFWCWIESERILHPVMRSFYKERDVVLEERRMRFEDDPNGKLYERLISVAFLAHPYRNPVIGYYEDISTLTAQATLEFQRQYYVPENIVVSVVGAVDPEKDLRTIERYFGQIEKRRGPGRNYLPESLPEGERTFVLKSESAPELLIAYPKPVYPDKDDARLSVFLELFAGSRVSPLYDELVIKRQIAASVDEFEAPGMAFPNLFVFQLSAKSPHTNQELLKAFDDEVTRFLQNGPTSDRVEMAKRSIGMSYLKRLQSNSSMAQDLASSEQLFGGWAALVRWFEELAEVSVSDVREVAKRYLRKDVRTIGFLESK